ncbi:MAG: hypothetical protein LQ348_004731 [Seirophora lacunosa]|nr:MAG: hypothetical protein LQ348_004731 [Seirophora lacunosa]
MASTKAPTSFMAEHPSNPKLFTNRAMTRIRLQSWDACIDDCLHSIALLPTNMKAYYYLAQAQLALHHPNEALTSARTAYDLCLDAGSWNASTRNVSQLVLQAKKEKWEAAERERMRRRSDLLRELEDGLLAMRSFELENWAVKHGITVNTTAADNNNNNNNNNNNATNTTSTAAQEEKADILDTSRRKIEELRSVFAVADPVNLQRREVPDWLIDNISFCVMHDPVVTRTGASYERSTILEHLKRSPTDPLTREPLTVQDLRPNLLLKQACDAFLEENGWAVDY